MPRNSCEPRHRAHQKPVRRTAITVGGMLASSAAIAGASIVAVVAAGGTYAMWTSAATMSGGTISSASVDLTVNNQSSYALGGAAWSKLLPGDVVSQEVTLENTGTAASTVTAETSGPFGALLVHLARGGCPAPPAAPIAGPSSTVSPTDLGVFAAGEASVVCLQTTMPAGVADTVQGTGQDFTITFTAATES
ncbi:hypothetical protein GCM10022239_15170 [Leifsonia bigeumensis]|uniref:Ribosomally synthesized peptide with SipW-like signal peptide n=1 Tax=Leifsonella bigeumensis TaxID=433643 RepID=A0ABP7FJ83_9MICO